MFRHIKDSWKIKTFVTGLNVGVGSLYLYVFKLQNSELDLKKHNMYSIDNIKDFNKDFDKEKIINNLKKKQDIASSYISNINVYCSDYFGTFKYNGRHYLLLDFNDAMNDIDDGPFYHELSHCLNNDCSNLISLKYLYYLGISPLMVLLPSRFFMLSHYACWYTYTLIKRNKEKNADILAARMMGTAIPLITYFQVLQQKNISVRNEVPISKYLINESGDTYLDVFHPSLSKRIRYLTNITF
jgi:hypothetical protein